MKKITITIDKMGNAAFENEGAAEAARILKELAGKIERGYTPEALLDYNGNPVGKVVYKYK